MLEVTSPSYLPLLSGHQIRGFLTLSGQSVTSGASVGTVVGDFSVIGGSTRTYTYTLVTDPSTYFTISKSTLAVNAVLSVGTDIITVRASDTGRSVVNGTFAISIVSSAAVPYTPTWPYFGF